MKTTFLIGEPSTVFMRWWNKVPKHIHTTFFAALIMGTLTHLFSMTNSLPNHDVVGLFSTTIGGSISFDITLGRWFLPLFEAVSGNLAMPAIGIMLSVLYMSIAACFVVSVLRITNSVFCVLTAGIMVSFPAVCCTIAYLADGFFAAMLLSAMCVFMVQRHKWGFIWGSILLTLATGIYQAYFCFAAALMVVVLIADVLRGEHNAKQILFNGIRYLVTLVIAITSYYLATRLVLIVFHTSLSAYMGISNMGVFSLSSIPSLIAQTYKGFFDFYLKSYIPTLSVALGIAFKIFIALFVGMALYLVIEKKRIREPGSILLLLLLVGLLPLASNLILVLTNGTRPHMLMVYALITPFLLISAVSDIFAKSVKKEDKIVIGPSLKNAVCWVSVIILFAMTFKFYLVTNEAYLRLYNTYEQTYSFYTKLTGRVESTKGFTVDTPVMIIGYVDDTTKPSSLTEFGKLGGLTGISGENELINSYSRMNFLSNMLGAKYVIPDNTLQQELSKNTEVMAMPRYPSDGSIGIIDGVIVVKLGDPS